MELLYQSKIKPIQLITLGLFFAIKISTARYVLVEIEDDVEGEITEHAGSLINLRIDKLLIKYYLR